jgi:hypothetical protein
VNDFSTIYLGRMRCQGRFVEPVSRDDHSKNRSYYEKNDRDVGDSSLAVQPYIAFCVKYSARTTFTASGMDTVFRALLGRLTASGTRDLLSACSRPMLSL